MNKLIIPLFFVLTLFSCTGQKEKNLTDVIAVSITPEEYLVKTIGGADFKVEVMIPSGSGHGTYDPTPSQIIALSKAEAYVLNGNLGFEKAWFEKFREVNKNMQVVNLSEGQDLLSSMEEHGDHFHPAGIDPHFWMSPRSAEKMALSIFDLLVTLKPEREGFYQHNLDSILGILQETDSLITESLAPYKGYSFMIFHPALAYFARDYGLIQHAVELEGKEPSAKGISELVDLAKKEKIGIIFVQREYDRKAADAIANETGATVVIIDPLSPDLPESIMTVANALKINFENQPGIE